MQLTRQRGFTLLEMLLVALLMGLTAAAVTMSFNTTGPQQILKKNAERFIAATELVLDETVLSGNFIGIVIEETEYKFVVYNEAKWQFVQDDRLLSVQTMEPGIKLDLILDGMPLNQEEDEDASWFDEPFIEDETEEEKKKHPEPQILLFPSGEVTPFELSFITINERKESVIVTVIGDALGRISIRQPNEDI